MLDPALRWAASKLPDLDGIRPSSFSSSLGVSNSILLSDLFT
jgi:hypothetical protein